MPLRHRFGRFEVRPDERVLLVGGEAAALGARAFDLLLALIEHSDRLVTKEELLQLVWPGLVVGENNLHTQISTLRGLLGNQAIATIAGRGYRFSMKLEKGPVEAAPHHAISAALETANTAAHDGQAGLLPVDTGPAGTAPSGPNITAQSTRKLAAILSSDVVGYSRLMGEDDRATLQAIVATRGVMAAHITGHGGRVVDASGDALLAEFPSAIESVRCAVAIQIELTQRNAALPEPRRMVLRIGLNVGDVIEQDAALYGEGVNVAARLQALGEPGGVCISGSIFDQIDGKLPLVFRFAGEQAVKNIAKAVRAYHVRTEGLTAAARAPVSPCAGDSSAYRFGSVEIRPDERLLLVADEPVKLGSRAFDVLLALIHLRERVVPKNELLDLVWPGLVLEENNLPTQISSLRKLLGPQAIQTIPGRGYRFVAKLKGLHEDLSPQPEPAPTTVAPAVAQATAPSAAASAPCPEFKTNLPEALPQLFGREDDVAALGTLIAQQRLISIVAPGGMGKTLLALHLLHERRRGFEHGVCWVELAGLSDPQLVTGTIASALGIQTGTGDALMGLVSALKGVTVMVALDNAEHLIDEVARVVQALIDGVPQLKLLVTSQVPLKCAKERVYRLGALAVPDTVVPVEEALTFGAIALFVECAQAADRHFKLTPGNVATVIEICRHLDGMALAIELAAARVPLLGVTKLATTLNERLRVLTGGLRTAPQRHKTLRAALEWSHALLNPTEQAVFRRLGVFAGSFGLGMAQQVVAGETIEPPLDEWAVLDVLGALVDRSLVMVDAGEPPRYRLLESPRAYALEQLAAASEEAEWRRRHAHSVLKHFTAVNVDCWGGRIGVDDAIAMLEPDLDNVRETLTWALANDAQTAVAAGPAMELVLTYARRGELLNVWEATAKLITDTMPASLRADWAAGCARFWTAERPARAGQWARMAIDLYQRIGDPIGKYQGLASLCISETSLASGLQHQLLQELTALEDSNWPPWVRYRGASAEFFLGITSCNFASAKMSLQRGVVLAARAGSSSAVLQTMGNLADTALAAGDVDEAVRTGIEVERQASNSIRDRHSLASSRVNLTGALLAQGSVAEARVMAKAAWPLAKEFLRLDWLADNAALLAALEGRARAAAKLCGFADAIYSTEGGAVRQVNEARAAERAKGIACEAIGDSEFERLKAEGARLSAEAAESLAFGPAENS